MIGEAVFTYDAVDIDLNQIELKNVINYESQKEYIEKIKNKFKI